MELFINTPFMKHYKFNNGFLKTLLKQVTLENKPFVITGNFNLNLFKYMPNTGVKQFFEKNFSKKFIPK